MKWQEMQFQHYNKKEGKMRIIGITGSSGSGKTTICEILKTKHNAYIIDADEVAKKLARSGCMYLNEIVKNFGEDIVDEQGVLRRKELANIIYSNEQKRKILNELTFKYVVDEIKEEINRVADKEIVVIDAPLLFESKLDEVCDEVVGVIADEEDKIKRICDRDKIDEEIARKRLNIQMKDEHIREKVDYIICNEGSMKKLEEKIKNIIRRFN